MIHDANIKHYELQARPLTQYSLRTSQAAQRQQCCVAQLIGNMSNSILPLVAQLLNASIAILSLLVKLLTFFISALVWDPYLAAVSEKKRKDYAFRRQFNEKPSIIPGCPGSALLNVYSRYRLPRVVHAESLLQIPWACWLLGGGVRGAAFATCFVIFRLCIESYLNRGSQPVETRNRKARKRAKARALQPVPVHQLDYTIWNCIVAFFLAAHLWLIQGVIAGNSHASWTSPQYVKFIISLCVVWHLWKPSVKTGEWHLWKPSVKTGEGLSSNRVMLAWSRIDRAAKADLESL